MNTLHLPLKARYYNMIESGEKPEEYREIKPYWIKRLCFTKQQDGCCFCNSANECIRCLNGGGYMCYPFLLVEFSFGYTKRRMTWEVKGITIGQGNPAWGAPEDEEVFIIKLGRRVS